jgi:hypothetical protein
MDVLQAATPAPALVLGPGRGPMRLSFVAIFSDPSFASFHILRHLRLSGSRTVLCVLAAASGEWPEPPTPRLEFGSRRHIYAGELDGSRSSPGGVAVHQLRLAGRRVDHGARSAVAINVEAAHRDLPASNAEPDGDRAPGHPLVDHLRLVAYRSSRFHGHRFGGAVVVLKPPDRYRADLGTVLRMLR